MWYQTFGPQCMCKRETYFSSGKSIYSSNVKGFSDYHLGTLLLMIMSNGLIIFSTSSGTE